jgi:hypothetical protein
MKQSTEVEEKVGQDQIARVAPPKNFPTCEHLKHLRQSRLVRSMHIWLIVVPILAKFSAKLSNTPPIEVFGTALDLNYELPFSWQLFYFSALAFSIGNLIYIFRCPRIIVDHNNPGEFHESGKGFDQIVHYAFDAGLSKKEIQDNVDKTMEEIQSVPKRYNRLFWIFYDHANKQRGTWLWSGALAFVVGLALIGIVLGQNLLAVLRLTFLS